MGRWIDRAAKLEAGAGAWDNRDNRDDSSAETPDDGANDPIAPNAPDTLPPDVCSGLEVMRTMVAPRTVKREAWQEVVADALGLAKAGWVIPAMRLGWTALDLFGAVIDPSGDPDADGLAVKLSGRRLLAISAKSATVDDGNGGRSYLYRHTSEGARLLWELGGGR